MPMRKPLSRGFCPRVIHAKQFELVRIVMECGPVAFDDGGVLSNGARQFQIGGVRSAAPKMLSNLRACGREGRGRIYAMTLLA